MSISSVPRDPESPAPAPAADAVPNVPGTVNLSKATSPSAYGQSLYPVAQPPHDPLLWPATKKTLILLTLCLYSFLSNSALIGPSVFLATWAEEFEMSENKAAHLVSYSNLAYGFSAIVMVPFYLKFGRRLCMIVSIIIYIAGLLGCALSPSYASLMIFRVLHSFGAGVCEALPVQLVNDIFYLHERGSKLGWYTAALCLGATGPMWAGWIGEWRRFFWIEMGLACGLLVLAVAVVEESYFERKSVPVSVDEKKTVDTDEKASTPVAASINDSDSATPVSSATILAPFTFTPPRTPPLSPWTVPRSFTYFFVPPLFWTTVTYALYISLSALTFTYTFPLLVLAEPYNWPAHNTGLLSLATLTAYICALPLRHMSDKLAARLTLKNNLIRESEMRLGILLPAAFLAPIGLLVYGLAAFYKWHWFLYFFGAWLAQFAGFFYFTETLAYATESYTVNLSEMLIATNVGKQAISFGLSFDLLAWILQHGYAVTICGIFGSILFINNIMVVVFMLWGKKMRIWLNNTPLAAMHRRSVTEVVVA